MPIARIRHTKARSIAGFGARARIRRERWTGKDALAHIVGERRALRTLPETYFRKTPRSPHSPNDLVGHPASHRQRHLEALLAETA
ncbi:MAG: hypothetical protein AUG02_04815 [Chloroflexi bacterium 13_1_20CM_2_70_9]|nr:MAG: hypothetical protein AUG02_04815 [Chloroflexi bacterium 13_1_20CM_2_70_9]